MCKRCLIALVSALACLCSCGGGDALRDMESLPDLLAAVPSDALAVFSFSRCEQAGEPLDSTDILSSLDLSAFADSPAVLSMSYSGSLVPTLSVGTGMQDGGPAVFSAMRQAERKGVLAEYFAPDEASGRQGFMSFTASESQMAALKRHVGSGSSVLDAPGFPDAAALTSGDDFIIFRNSGARNLIPRGFLGGIFQKRPLAEFLHKAADWTVLCPDERGTYRLSTVQGEADSYYVNMLASLPFGRSRVGQVLPDSVDFVLSLPLPQPQFRGSYERYVDASVRMTSYGRHLSDLEKACGKAPLKWEKEVCPAEIALVSWGGKTAVLLRPQKMVRDMEIGDNPFRGFLPALYGEAFSLRDDSCLGAVCGWYAIGSREAVEELTARKEPRADAVWPGKSCHFVLYHSGRFFAWGKKGMRLWSSNL